MSTAARASRGCRGATSSATTARVRCGRCATRGAPDLREHTDELGGAAQLDGLVSFGEDGAGELYLVSIDQGTVYRVDAAWPSFCDGFDGALAACPCANPGAPETGCDLAQATGGVRLDVLAQETSPQNRATLAGAGFPQAGSPGVTVIRADAADPAAPVVFGDGLRCIGTPIVRVGATLAGGGTSTQTVGHGAMAGGGTFLYQLWLRNTPAMYCDPSAAFNLSNGRTIAW